MSWFTSAAVATIANGHIIFFPVSTGQGNECKNIYSYITSVHGETVRVKNKQDQQQQRKENKTIIAEI